MIISVVVPAFNEEKLLGATLRSMREAMTAFTQAGWEAELIVCDNNSTDRTAAIALEAGARVVFEPINQIARARNTGAAAARGDWLVFVDADSHPSRGLFADVVQAIRAGDVMAGGSTVRMEGHHRLAQWFTQWWNVLSRVKRWASGSFIFCDAEIFRQTGGFSQELFASEEIDLFRRLNRMARTVRRRIVILHRHPLRTSDRKMHLYGLGEYMRFLGRSILARGRTLRSARECHPWYDGRR